MEETLMGFRARQQKHFAKTHHRLPNTAKRDTNIQKDKLNYITSSQESYF